MNGRHGQGGGERDREHAGGDRRHAGQPRPLQPPGAVRVTASRSAAPVAQSRSPTQAPASTAPPLSR